MQSSSIDLKDILTPFQQAVFDYIGKNEGEYLSITKIQEGLRDNAIIMHFSTAKRCIKALLKYRAISIKERRRIGRSSFMIIETTKQQERTMSDKHYLDFVDEEYDPEKDYSVDKSIYEKWNDEDYTEFSKKKAISMMTKHPELKYWTEKGLTLKQIDKWCSDLDIDNANMCENLKFCAYDLRVNKKEHDSNGNPIQSAINYFYTSINKNCGFYPKPENYKSHRQMLIEKNKRRLAEREKQIKELRDARLKKEAAEYEVLFEKMLAETESKIHKECLEKIENDYQLRSLSRGLPSERSKAMRVAYAEIQGIEGFEERPDYLKEAREEAREKERYMQKIEGYRE